MELSSKKYFHKDYTYTNADTYPCIQVLLYYLYTTVYSLARGFKFQWALAI